MWHAFSELVAALLSAVFSIFPSSNLGDATTAIRALPSGLFTVPAAMFTVFGLFIDWSVFFGCLYTVFAWRALWLFLRVIQIILEFVPFF